MNRLEGSSPLPADELGIANHRLHHQPEPAPAFELANSMPNNGLAGSERTIDKIHGLGALTTADILLAVGINPHKPGPTTTEFKNID